MPVYLFGDPRERDPGMDGAMGIPNIIPIPHQQGRQRASLFTQTWRLIKRARGVGPSRMKQKNAFLASFLLSAGPIDR